MVNSGSTTPIQATPFLKWAGGKSRLLAQYEPYFPTIEQGTRYYEPFVGSAAVFFHLLPESGTLSDANEKLVEVYEIVQKQVEALIVTLREHRNEKDYYYKIRALNPADLTTVERAARIIYLNKTCYNGLYRENRQGQFNVPFGRYKNPTICDGSRLRQASQALQRTRILVADFEEISKEAAAGDFFYFDPPYVPLSTTSNFTSYDHRGFDVEDQRRLARVIKRLTTKGVLVMLSNSSAPLVYELYDKSQYRLIKIHARRNINSKAERRGPIEELLILNY